MASGAPGGRPPHLMFISLCVSGEFLVKYLLKIEKLKKTASEM